MIVCVQKVLDGIPKPHNARSSVMKLPMPPASLKTVFTLAHALILTILCLRHWLVPITARLSSMQQN